MTTAQLHPSTEASPRDNLPASSDQSARVSFRQPVSTIGFIDAAWWPRSLDLTAELPPLLDVLWTASREITLVTYNLAAWDPAPRRMFVQDRVVRLGGFTTSDRLIVRLSDPWGSERVDMLVIPPETDPAIAQRALLMASAIDSPYRAAEILLRAADDRNVS